MIEGIGVDIVSISRIERVIECWGTRFLRRIFLSNELNYAMAKSRPYASLAGIFAAKEACAKALGWGIGSISWQDINVQRDEKGRPFLILSDSAIKQVKNASNMRWHLSISHDCDKAIAVVVLEAFKEVDCFAFDSQ